MKDQIEKCIEVLKQGGVIIYPTDTIWGIGCDATNAEAVEKVYAVKGRSQTKSLIVLVDSDNRLERYVKEVPDIAWELIDQVDTPLTLIYPEGIQLAPNVLAEDKSVAIRIVKDNFCRELIRRFNKPIVSTSANFSGDPSPLNFDQISSKLLQSVDYVVDWNREKRNSSQPSSIIKVGLKGEIELIR